MTQPLFKRSEHRLLVAAIEIDDAIGFKAGLREARRKKVRPPHAPKRLALCARRDPRDKECSRRVAGYAAARHFMQRPPRQASAWQA